MRRILFSWSCLLFLAWNASSQENVVISEFMASNGSTFLDEDGDYSDWIEIHNAGPTTVNLLNWSLTDSAGNLTKWRFPETNIVADGYMLVFASEKDRRVPGAPLHTNFKLGADGEYLALVAPDGTNVISQFSPAYPPQARDVSYGEGIFSTNSIVISSNSPVRVSVPANGADGLNWTATTFDDGDWTAGINGVGFGSTNVIQANYSLTVAPTMPVGYWRLNESSGTTAANTGSGGGLGGTYTSTTVGTAGPRPPDLPGFEPDNRAPTFDGTSSYLSVNSSLLNNLAAFTLAGWIKPAATPGSRIGLFGQNDCVEFGFVAPTQIQVWTPGGGSTTVDYPFSPNEWHHIAAVGNGTTLQVFLDGVVAPVAAGGGSATGNYGSSSYLFNVGGGGVFDATGNFFNGQIDEVAVYYRALSALEVSSLYQGGLSPAGFSVVPFVRTDVGPAMSNVNATAYIRLPFSVADPANVSLLTMRVRYNDGFIAYLNGSEVIRANAPEAPAYNSAATDSHSAVAVEEFRFGATMLAENNVLAIQGLNLAADDPDFLIDVELEVSTVAAASPTPVYFTTPSPGLPNGSGVAYPGPAVVETAHTPNVPKDDEDLTVTARVTPTFFPLASVVMRYRIMFNAEMEVTMTDDGLHGDGAAGDGVFGATIPAGVSTNGQMVRWYFRATDEMGSVSRWPLFLDPADGPEYEGTIVEPVNLETKLPVLHLFAQPNVLQPGPTTSQTGADSQAGARGISAFSDGEFYDNIYMSLRGNSTSGYNKKSHRLEFNRSHLFHHRGPGPRLRKTSFEADYPDPTYMRQGLSFWLCDLMGSPAPFYIPYRLQLNGRFYQLANHNDVHGEELLSRLGYDPNGALYNAAGTIQTSQFSTGGFEKKTRKWEGNADYTAMANAIAESNPLATREANFFDLFDVPNVLDYLVTARWAHENDDVWANMSVYHDNDGDGQWRIVSFDMNLSWGAIFYEGSNPSVVEGVQATNDIHKAHPLYGSSATPALNSGNYNRIYDTVFLVPRLREMFLRRMRTLMDTYVKPPGTHPLLLPMEKKVMEISDLIAEEADRDRDFWGWPPKGGQGNFDPGIRFQDGVQALIDDFIVKRRIHFYVKHSVNNTSLPIGITKDSNAGIPNSQPTDAVIEIAGLDYNPVSGNQAEEYICLTNANPFALDISGWKLDGAVNFTFHPGTVIGSNTVLYVSPDVRAFKSRATSPHGGQGLFVVGPYQGQLSARGESIELFDDKGRGVSTNRYTGNPSLAQQSLRITEIMYNPSPLGGDTASAQDYEYIEIKNIGSTQVSLAGVRLTDGVQFDFSSGSVPVLAAGQTVLVVKNMAAFTARYGSGAVIAGEFSGWLENRGERVRLLDASNEEILDFSYDNKWYRITDGLGFSLVIVNENTEPDLWDVASSWRPSGALEGNPGGNDPGAPVIAPILINELLTHTDPPTVDAVELYNPTDAEVDLGGWFLSDDFRTPLKYRIPNGTNIAAHSYLVFNETQFNTTPGIFPSFSFSSKGDEVYLFSGDPNGTALTGYFHGYTYGAAENGVSFGPYVTSTGREDFVAQSSLTLNGPNSGPKVGPVVISEIMYRPPDRAGADNVFDEFVELHNISAASVDLFDSSAPTNTWRLAHAVSFSFPTNTSLPAGADALVVSFDPADAALLAEFRTHYSLPAGRAVFGPYKGKLNNSNERIDLLRPDTPELGEVPYIVMDRVAYDDGLEWPSGADGRGPSLQRVDPNAYGNDPINWIAATPTPGDPFNSAAVPTITSQPASQNVVVIGEATLNVTADGDVPLRYQWLFNDRPIENATASSLQIAQAVPKQEGDYRVLVYNAGGSVLSDPAHLAVLIPANIVSQPKPVSLREGESANFTVEASSDSPLSYQWRKNGVPIPGATAAHYAIASVQRGDDAIYDVVVTDLVGPIVSDGVRLTVLINPSVIIVPLTQEVPLGGTATFSIKTDGTLPMGYRWRRGSFTVTNVVLNSDQAFLTIHNVQSGDAGSYSVVLTNEASYTPGILVRGFNLVVLSDTDGDGLPDVYETSVGLNPNSPDDANADDDHDSMSNKEEYIAGTDPKDPNSYLKTEKIRLDGPVKIEFQAVSNKTYSLVYKSAPTDPDWNPLADVVADVTNRTVVIEDAPDHTNRIYRIATPKME
jgi:CotH kinase protein/Concanavalin A-like lectin/glucanases superfamily/Lamin Tail Domain/Immunoglobulin I-set domain